MQFLPSVFLSFLGRLAKILVDNKSTIILNYNSQYYKEVGARKDGKMGERERGLSLIQLL